ncbi:MAG TPA: hypothetical protein VLF79_02965 [Candidatus Saccharimonadales bacterium]|nr:hypothetical protein [Candidatus Saccharimonadales bacterium]
MTAKDKDTIYIDIDDEITGIIDKLKGSPSKVVALVLPKRASVFQSIVNMKLLKRAADSSKKNLVLITSEAGLLPLAGAAGVHVAKTLSSKPTIPLAPALTDDSEDTVDEDAGQSDEVPIDGATPVGLLAGAAALTPPPAEGGVETLELDDDIPPEAATKPPAGGRSFDPPKSKGKKDKKLKIPDFDRFRMLLVVGALILALLISGIIFATVALPKATINIKTDATSVDANLGLNLSTTAKTLDLPNSVIPAKLASQQKSYSQQAPTTGQKNNGNKASGAVTLTNCSGDNILLPSGTGLSSGGNTFITQQTVNVPDSVYSKDGSCHNNGHANVDVIAQNGGTSYNGANSFTVAGYSSSNLSGTPSSTISGGTDNIVQTVNQNDINTAKNKIPATDESVKKALETQLKSQGLYPLSATYTAGTPVVTSSPALGQVGNTVTVTEMVTYTEFGVKQEDLNKLIDDNVNNQIDPSKQKILDRGLAKAVYNVDSINNTSAQITLSTKVTAGPDLNINDIKQQAAGQKAGAIKASLSSNPDVTNVDVKLSPFWISSAPKKTSRITVHIAKPASTSKSSNSGAGNP